MRFQESHVCTKKGAFSICCVAVLSLLLLSPICWAQETKAPEASRPGYFEVGIGVVIGSGYKDALKVAYEGDYDISGGGGWIDVQAGFGIWATKNIAIEPRIRMLACPIKIQGYAGFPPSEKATIALLPGVSARYCLKPTGNTFYGGVDVALISLSSDMERVELKSNGIAKGVFCGYMLERIEFELGYIDVPVKTGSPTDDIYYYSTTTTETKRNFGGVSLSVRTRFNL